MGRTDGKEEEVDPISTWNGSLCSFCMTDGLQEMSFTVAWDGMKGISTIILLGK